jgi:hypothetical protein
LPHVAASPLDSCKLRLHSPVGKTLYAMSWDTEYFESLSVLVKKCSDNGFKKKWSKDDAFSITYAYKSMSVHIWGWGYGESGHISLNIGEEKLPYHEYATPLNKKLTESTGKKQLDDLKEHAYRLKNECQQILKGDLSSLLPYRPFPNAENLWQKRAFAQIVQQLQNSKVPLTETWKNRYEHALKNA